MKRPTLAAFGLWLSLFSLPGSAHESLPQNWCTSSGGTPTVIATFSFNQAQLQQYADTAAPPANCGVVDNWHWAKRMSEAYCAAQPSNLGTVQPFASAPGSFNSPNLHHVLYNFSQGLAGSCVVCVPPPLPAD